MSGRRSYDARHRRDRAIAIAAMTPGSPCARCGHPMWPAEDRLELDHDDSGDDYLGLSHGSPCQVCGQRCNQKAGGELAARLAGKRLRRRRCVVCGLPYEATSGSSGALQVTCGRSPCVAEIRRRRALRSGDGEAPAADGRVW